MAGRACFIPLMLFATAAAAQLPDDFHRGVNYAHVHRGGRGYGSDISKQTLRELHAMGVRYVALTPFGYQRTHDADYVRGGGDPGDRLLRDEAKAAHAAGLKVMLKPHIWSSDFWRGNQWHGTVDQKDPAAHTRWWQDYRRMVLNLAKLAQEAGIEAYCLGTELVKMTTKYPEEWRDLIRDVRTIYRGKLTYAAHWYEELDQITFWDKLDFVGVSAYFPLDAPVGADVATLRSAWSPHVKRLRELHQRSGKSIMFLEAGYRGVDNCHREPWAYDGGTPDPDAQARAYEALFATFADKAWFRGLYYWKAFTAPRRGRRQDFGIRGQPAETVVRAWYAPVTKLP